MPRPTDRRAYDGRDPFFLASRRSEPPVFDPAIRLVLAASHPASVRQPLTPAELASATRAGYADFHVETAR